MAFQMCRVCYKKGYDLRSLHEDKNCYLQKLTSCIPEIDVYVIANPGICDKCAKMLDIAFELREICLKNDQQYNISLKTMEVKTTHADDPIQLQLLRIDNVIPKKEVCICYLCDVEFESRHDKRMHDYKLHRLDKHRELRTFLEPVIDIKCSPMRKPLDLIPLVGTSPLLPDNDADMEVDDCIIVNTNLQGEDIKNFKKKCSICNQKFDTKVELDNHMKLHFAKCCGESFVTVSLLQLHMYMEHGRTCGICDENFDDVSALFHHAPDHIENDWYKCNFCGKQFKEDVDLERHKCTYYTCAVCQIIYFTRKVYNTHMTTHVSQVKDDDKIVKTIPSDRKLRKKIRKQKEYTPISCCICRLCDARFQLNIQLRMHMLRNHSDLEATISLVDCRKDKFYQEQEGLSINFEIKDDEKNGTKTDIAPNFKSNRNRKTRTRGNNIETKDVGERNGIVEDDRTCFMCKSMFATNSSFSDHMNHYHKTCCGQQLRNPAAKRKHNALHLEQGVGNHEIICTECLLMCDTHDDLLAHACTYTSIKS